MITLGCSDQLHSNGVVGRRRSSSIYPALAKLK
jgi:hypothetical protein